MRYSSQDVIHYETYKAYEKFHITWANPGIQLRGIDRWEGRGKQTRHSCTGTSSVLKSRLLYLGVIWSKTPRGSSMDKDKSKHPRDGDT